MSFVMVRLSILLVALTLLTGCTRAAQLSSSAPAQDPHAHEVEAAMLPELAPISLAAGEKLQVVVSSNIVADVVAQIGGDEIELYVMLPTGADPHSYQATPQDLRRLTDADVIFINGLGLEEAMGSVFDEFAAKTIVVNTGFDPIQIGADHGEDEATEEGHEAHGDDPHTWFSIHAVEVWTENIAHVLGALDPANAEGYTAAAAAYQVELDALHEELAALTTQIPADQRKVVTDHDSLGYLAAEYGFEVVGSVIPSFSTLAEPSAQQLTALQEQIRAEGVRAIFVSSAVSARMESQLAQDLGIQLVRIYTGSLSEADGPAGNYLDFMRYNMNAIVDALRAE